VEVKGRRKLIIVHVQKIRRELMKHYLKTIIIKKKKVTYLLKNNYYEKEQDNIFTENIQSLIVCRNGT
jgi:hypothetical protein